MEHEFLARAVVWCAYLSLSLRLDQVSLSTTSHTSKVFCNSDDISMRTR